MKCEFVQWMENSECDIKYMLASRTEHSIFAFIRHTEIISDAVNVLFNLMHKPIFRMLLCFNDNPIVAIMYTCM